jgi:hypothetical protein
MEEAVTEMNKKYDDLKSTECEKDNRLMTRTSEHATKPLVFINRWELLRKISYHQVLKKDCK